MLRGKVWEVQSDRLIIDVQGVGYQVSTPYGFMSKCHSGQEITIYTHVILREEELALYGFPSLAEKELFLQMLTVSGIGPKASMAILSTLGSAQTESAIAGENLTLLTKVPGVGKKTAQRLILELKEKFKGKAGIELAGEGAVLTNDQAINRSEALESLLALGFSQEEARKALQSLPNAGEGLKTEEQIRLALRSLAAGN